MIRTPAARSTDAPPPPSFGRTTAALGSDHDADFGLPESLSLARKALEPFTGYPGEYRKHLDASVAAMSEGVEDMRSGKAARTIVGVFRTGAGAIGYAVSPLTAATRSLIGKPAERLTRAAGGSEGLSRFVGDTADLGANFALGAGLGAGPVRGATAFAHTARLSRKVKAERAGALEEGDGASRSIAGNPSSYRTLPLQQRFVGEELGGPDSWTEFPVRYFSEAERTSHRVVIRGGKLNDSSGKLLDTTLSKTHFNNGGAMYVMDGSGSIFASSSQVPGKVHHSSLVAGGPVAAAGEMEVVGGVPRVITNQSGHYRPAPEHTEQFVHRLREGGVDTSMIDVRNPFYSPPSHANRLDLW